MVKSSAPNPNCGMAEILSLTFSLSPQVPIRLSSEKGRHAEGNLCLSHQSTDVAYAEKLEILSYTHTPCTIVFGNNLGEWKKHLIIRP